MTSPAAIGERVRVLRLAANISQSELARAITGRDVPSNKLVSQIENGRHPIDDDLLSTLAIGLQCTPEFLLRGRHDAVSTRPWLRAYADANAKTVDSVMADDLIAHEVITTLQLKRIPDQIPLFHDDLNDGDAIERFADEVRVAADIAPDAVVGNAMRAADRLGCVVLPLVSELGRHLGMSHRIDGVPFVRVSRPGEGGVPGDRQRFTIAHEIGHLGLHSHMPPPATAADAQRIERQAHRFASAFLAPAQPLIEDWERLGGRVTLSTLAELKATWGIAIKALVVRFQQLGIIDADQATSLYKQISKRGWNKHEPVPTTNEEPIWLQRALDRRARTEPAIEEAVTIAARVVGLSERMVSRWIDWSSVSSEDVALPIPLEGRIRRTPSSRREGHGEVTPISSRRR
ncbi:XRE family transcriptional regulator [Blastococcus sp. TF02A-35]|uniref:helix-turn-helix domain-containing protein n=1 Tax=Blastococcus sp. TF02A-35 TaxID=2559612 RepID=UPI0010744D74|nr:XRE family transcriptional regulator [Blastococcus sp. TF02A_35]TFV52495.1 ImmA/IrrE family metallo-endopeptidase [Blastococcus sp. TF02A_35]